MTPAPAISSPTRLVAKLDVPSPERALAETAKVLSRLGPRLPGLARELLMMAEDVRTQRTRPADQTAPTRSAMRWGVLGAAIGALAVYLWGQM